MIPVRRFCELAFEHGSLTTPTLSKLTPVLSAPKEQLGDPTKAKNQPGLEPATSVEDFRHEVDHDLNRLREKTLRDAGHKLPDRGHDQ